MSRGKQKIMDAAFRLFSEKGFNAVGIREIGEAAGYTNPALYQHFKNKYDLGKELYLTAYQKLMDEIDSRIQPGMSGMEKIEAHIDASIALHETSPSILLYIEDQQGQFGFIARDIFGEKAVTRRYAAWIAEGQQEGDIRTDLPIPFLIGVVLGQLTTWAILSQKGLAPREGVNKAIKVLSRSALVPSE